jgi:Fe-S cluster assembly protein SufD
MTDAIQKINDRYQASDALHDLKEHAIADFRKLGIPTVKHEEWKYTRVGSLLQNNLEVQAPDQVKPEDIEALKLPGDAHEIFVINGRFSSASAPEGMIISSLGAEAKGQYKGIIEQHLGTSSKYHPDGINAMNTAFADHGLFIFINRGKKIDKPVYIYYINDNRSFPTLSLPRALVYVSAAAEVEITEHYISLGANDSFTNQVTEFVVEQDAIVNYYKIQNEGPNASQVSTTQFTQIGKSLTNATTISLSGNIIRNNLNMVMEAEHGESHMYGLYLLDGKTHVDNHTIVDNVMPNCFSNELYKGIMDGESTGVFNGKIFVRQDAQKTNAYQSNKNVLLTDTASVNTKPQLEIFADDVKCSHGCTIGKLDEEALFYLRARGIGERSAKSLLLHAFAVDILENIKSEPLRTYVDQLISERLEFNF